MTPNPWLVRLTGLIFLTFALIPALAQVADSLAVLDSLAGTSIRLSFDINKEVVLFPLSDKVNSDYVEAGPLISGSGKRLYYSRHGHPSNIGGTEDTDIWYSEFDDSTQSWSESRNIGAPLNNAGPNFVCEVGWTDDTLMVANRYSKTGKMKAGVSVSVWNGNSWSVPSPINIKNDYNLAENVSYDLSSYRNVILIAEQKIDSHGKTDLYVAFRDHSGSRTTTESINLGPEINSVGSERSPFLTDDMQTIYFASDGHNGYGHLDIFRAHRLDDTWTSWSLPENLGPGINTPFDDGNFIFGSTSRYAYYSRGVGESRSDIYGVSMSSLFVEEMSAIQDLALRTIITEPGQPFTLKDAFLAERADLTDSAVNELKHVVTYMQRLKDPVLFLGTHSNLHTNRSQSLTLSDQRLEEVKKFFIASGIDKGRIQGESNGHDVTETNSWNYLSNSLELRFINKVVVRTPVKGPK